AYVANARDGTVSVIDLPSGQVSMPIVVGAEPRAVAISPNGTRLFVADSASNDVRVIDTASRAVVATVDVSPFGTAPRALAVTNTGDSNDADETVYVALFFAQLRPGKTFLDEGQDDQREGRVVAISAATDGVNPPPAVITLGPLANTGFNANGRLAPAT